MRASFRTLLVRLPFLLSMLSSPKPGERVPDKCEKHSRRTWAQHLWRSQRCAPRSASHTLFCTFLLCCAQHRNISLFSGHIFTIVNIQIKINFKGPLCSRIIWYWPFGCANKDSSGSERGESSDVFLTTVLLKWNSTFMP